DGREAMPRGVGGDPAGGMAEPQPVPSRGQVEGVGLAQDALGHDDAETAADGWQRTGPCDTLHGRLPLGRAKGLLCHTFSLALTGARSTRLRNIEVAIRPAGPDGLQIRPTTCAHAMREPL